MYLVKWSRSRSSRQWPSCPMYRMATALRTLPNFLLLPGIWRMQASTSELLQALLILFLREGGECVLFLYYKDPKKAIDVSRDILGQESSMWFSQVKTWCLKHLEKAGDSLTLDNIWHDERWKWYLLDLDVVDSVVFIKLTINHKSSCVIYVYLICACDMWF